MITKEFIKTLAKKLKSEDFINRLEKASQYPNIKSIPAVKKLIDDEVDAAKKEYKKKIKIK